MMKSANAIALIACLTGCCFADHITGDGSRRLRESDVLIYSEEIGLIHRSITVTTDGVAVLHIQSFDGSRRIVKRISSETLHDLKTIINQSDFFSLPSTVGQMAYSLTPRILSVR